MSLIFAHHILGGYVCVCVCVVSEKACFCIYAMWMMLFAYVWWVMECLHKNFPAYRTQTPFTFLPHILPNAYMHSCTRWAGARARMEIQLESTACHIIFIGIEPRVPVASCNDSPAIFVFVSGSFDVMLMLMLCNAQLHNIYITNGIPSLAEIINPARFTFYFFFIIVHLAGNGCIWRKWHTHTHRNVQCHSASPNWGGGTAQANHHVVYSTWKMKIKLWQYLD